MKRLKESIIQFFHRQPYTIVTTFDTKGYPHCSCKGIVHIKKKGQVCLLDLYKEETYRNLKRNPHISITAVDEHHFMGYSLKGKAKITKGEDLKIDLIKAWEKRINKRITQRLIKNLQGQIGHSKHPEVLLPKPEYLIMVEVNEIIDLTPHHIKE